MGIQGAHANEAFINLREEVERSVLAAVTSGELAPGTLVSVPSLATQLSVSATPVREAMVNLQKRGCVVPVPNKGFRVTEVSEAELIEICQLRGWLECPAAEQIALNFPKERIKEFRLMADRIVTAVDEGDLAGFVNAEADFHDELMALSGNPASMTQYSYSDSAYELPD